MTPKKLMHPKLKRYAIQYAPDSTAYAVYDDEDDLIKDRYMMIDELKDLGFVDYEDIYLNCAEEIKLNDMKSSKKKDIIDILKKHFPQD